MSSRTSKKRYFIKNGLLYAELNQLFQRFLADDGYVGLEIRPHGSTTDIVIISTRPEAVIGEKGRRIRELAALIKRKFNYDTDKFRMYVDLVRNRSLNAVSQCESIKQKLATGVAVRKACYGAIRSAMMSGARGVEVIISGKIRGQRAKSMKFVDGIMIHSGNPVRENVDSATRSVLLKQGVLGIRVKINKKLFDETTDSKESNVTPLFMPDKVEIKKIVEETHSNEPHVIEHKDEATVQTINYTQPATTDQSNSYQPSQREYKNQPIFQRQ